MNNIEQAISFARQEYTRQGLDALYQKDFEEALLPALYRPPKFTGQTRSVGAAIPRRICSQRSFGAGSC